MCLLLDNGARVTGVDGGTFWKIELPVGEPGVKGREDGEADGELNRQPRTRDARRAQGAGSGRDAGVSVTRRGATEARNAAPAPAAGGSGQIAFAGGGLMNRPG